jgi:hypothetical protein
MITWLSRDITAKWLRVIVTGVIFSWLIWIAWWENRHYRNMTVLITQQFETLRDDHVRAQALLRMLAEQVFKGTVHDEAGVCQEVYLIGLHGGGG